MDNSTIAVRYVQSRTIDGRQLEAYQGRVSLPPSVATSVAGDDRSVRPVGYAEVEVSPRTPPDAVRAALAEEYAAGRWWVFVSREAGEMPVRLTTGTPLGSSVHCGKGETT